MKYKVTSYANLVKLPNSISRKKVTTEFKTRNDIDWMNEHKKEIGDLIYNDLVMQKAGVFGDVEIVSIKQLK
jgi:hypothetical protein